MKMTVGKLTEILSMYEDDVEVLLVEHQHRGAGAVLRMNQDEPMRMQREFTYRPGLDEPKEYVVFDVTDVCRTTDFAAPLGGPEDLDWPGKRTD